MTYYNLIFSFQTDTFLISGRGTYTVEVECKIVGDLNVRNAAHSMCGWSSSVCYSLINGYRSSTVTLPMPKQCYRIVSKMLDIHGTLECDNLTTLLIGPLFGNAILFEYCVWKSLNVCPSVQPFLCPSQNLPANVYHIWYMYIFKQIYCDQKEM